jgi:hypothetical protein
VPRAYGKEGTYKGKVMIERVLHLQKVREKRPKMVKYLKVPRAY